MSKNIFRAMAVLGACALMTTGSALAQGRGQGRGNAASRVWNGDHDWRGDRARWTFGEDQRPRGWEKGRKTGWGDCDVPPGQAKKMGCGWSWGGIRRDRREDWRERYRREPYRRYPQYRRDHDRR